MPAPIWRLRIRHQLRARDLGRNRLADEGFDVGERKAETLAREAHRVTLRASASGSADSMNVVLGILRQVVVEDVAHVRYV